MNHVLGGLWDITWRWAVSIAVLWLLFGR